MEKTVENYSIIRDKIIKGSKRAIEKIYLDARLNKKDFIISIDGKVVNLTKSNDAKLKD